MPIAEGIAAIKATLDLAKLTSDLVNRPNIDAESVRKNLHEMLIHAVNALTAIGEAQHELLTLRGKLDDKAALVALTADLEPVPDGGFLVKKSDKTAGHLIPYCPVCWGQEQKAIALVPMANGYYSCAIHPDASYQTKAYREEQQRRTAEMRRGDSSFTVVSPPNVRWMG